MPCVGWGSWAPIPERQGLVCVLGLGARLLVPPFLSLGCEGIRRFHMLLSSLQSFP